MRGTAAAAAVATASVGSVRAQTWNVNANGSWQTAGNWSPATVPNGIDGAATLGNVITLSRAVTLNAPVTLGSLSFSGNRSYTVQSSAAANTLTFDVGSGTAVISNTTTVAIQRINSNVVLADNLRIANNGANLLMLGGVVSGSGSLTQDGTGVTVLAGENTYTGGTTISAGTLRIGDNGAGSVVGNITNNAVLDLANGADVVYAGVISGSGSVTVTGTHILTGSSSYTGGTTISGGILKIGDGGTTGSIVGDITVNSGGQLFFNRSDTLTYAGTIANGGTVQNDGTGTLILSGAISGTGSVQSVGNKLILVANNTYTGGTGVAAGSTTQVGNGGTTGSIAGNVISGGTLAFNRSDTLVMAGTVSGAGSLTQVGSGTTVLTAANTYSGDTTVSAGTLQVGDGGTTGAIGSGNASVASGATLTFNRSNAFAYNGTIANAGTVTQSGGGTLTLGGIISGAGGLSQAGAGTTVLSAANSYAGATTVTTGTLRAGVANAFSSASATTVAAAATLDLDSLNQAVGSLAGAGSVTLGSATLTAGADNTGTTFSGAISGTGGLAKAGTGSMVLSGVNTYGGGTTISAGTLQLGNGGTVGSIAGNVTNDGTLAFNRSDSITFGGIVSGSGAVRQAGTGTTVLTATNTYSGGTTIASGTLQLGNGGTTGAIAGNVTNGGTLVFNRSDSVTFGGVVSGSGAVRQAGTGTTVLTANSSYSGTTTITAGTLQLGNGGTSGSLGSGAVVNDAVLTVNRADSLTIANAISGTGRLVQAGSGTTILTAASSFSGGTTVSSGTLVVNGSLASGVVVASGATLGGSGVIAGTLTVNGTIAPGNSIGTLSVTGTYVQNAGSTYRVEINPAGQSDRIAVTGTATLNGGTVQVVAGSGGYRHGTTTYTILTATGGVTGTFDGLVTDYAFRRVGLAYDATAVYLQVTGGTFVDGAQTINQNAVAQSLDAAWGSASGDFATVLGALMELNGSAGRAALETIGGQPWAGLPSTNLAGATLFMDAVGRQVAAARQATPGSRVTLAEACSGACDETVATSGWSAWAMVLGGTGNVAGDGNAAALSWTLGGFAAGIDHGFAPGVLAGVALGMTGGSQSVATFTGPSSVTAVQASLYASLSTGGSYVDAMAGYGTSDNQLTRVLSIPGLATRQARGRTGAHQLFAQVEAGHRFEIDRETRAGLAPYLRFQAASVAMNGFSEWGADSLDLSAAPWTTTSVRSVLGLQADAALAVGLEAPLGVQFRLGWSHEYADTARPFAATLAGAPANGFTVYGAQAPRDALTLGLGVEARLAASVAAFLRYDGLLATGADAHALGIGLRVAF